jgi:hypothetical protein
MRVLKVLIYSVLILGVIAGFSFLITRETLLWLASRQVKSDLKAAALKMEQSSEYRVACREKGLVEGATELIKDLRIRFVSSTEYNLEVVCSQFTLEPLIIEEKTLPQWVKKVPGSSGLVWDSNQSGVSFELWGRKKHLYLKGKNFFYSPLEGELENPKTTCSGYGYSCCHLEDSLGQGQKYTRVTDCAQSCFESCLPRPVILSVNTDPVFDPTFRVVEINSGGFVQFNVVADVRDQIQPELASYEIDYGDGQQEVLSAEELPFVHTYTCPRGSCLYYAKIKVVNADGLDSADTAVSQLRVQVK